MQKKQSEWKWQWEKVYDDNEWLFTEWIYPTKLKDFKGKTALDCGCGGGQHLNFIAPYCKEGVGIELNTVSVARKNTKKNKNLKIVQGDIAKINLRKKFDIVYSIGVLHHTDNPTKSLDNIKKMVKKGGKLIVWVYSHEGNFWNRTLVETLKKYFFLEINKESLWVISNIINALVYIPVYTIYLLPFKFLPFYEYFQNWRKLSFKRNNQNVFDKLNAPQTFFIRKSTMKKWFNPKEFKNIHISIYKGVSWRGSGVLK